MKLGNLFLAAAASGLGLCISLPGPSIAATTRINADVNQPLLVTQLLSGHIHIYYKNRNRYRALAYKNRYLVFNKFTAVSFVNTGQQPIEKITFRLAAFDNGYSPILNQDGQPVVKNMVASGPFAPDTTHSLVNANTVWTIPSGNGLGCIRLSGIAISYADGSTSTVPEAEINHYLPARLSNNCGVPAGRAAHQPRNFVTGPSPYIAGVYPAQWMITGLSRAEWSRQSYVPPSKTQFLCPVGSLVEETCIHTVNTPSSEDAL